MIHRALAHPNIVALIQAFERDGKLFIFLESLKTNLFEYMQPRSFDEETALKFFKEVVNAVAFLHSKRLVHRDIKPENVLLGENRRVKLCDFGFAATIEMGEKRDTFCGTQQYLPPEIVLGKDQTEKVDVWCLGVLLFELLHKRVPFTNKNIQAYLEAVTRKDLGFLSKVSQPVRRLIMACLEMEPNRRPTSAQILAELSAIEGAPRNQRAQSVITGDRQAKNNMKIFGGNQGALNSPRGAQPAYTNPALRLEIKPVTAVMSDKQPKEHLKPSQENWFDSAFVKKEAQDISGAQSANPHQHGQSFPSRPTPQLKIPPLARVDTKELTSASPQQSPVKIHLYQNTNFGPENFKKQLSLQISHGKEGVGSYTSDYRVSNEQPKASGSTANSYQQTPRSDNSGDPSRTTFFKDFNAVLKSDPPNLQRRNTDHLDLSPRRYEPVTTTHYHAQEGTKVVHSRTENSPAPRVMFGSPSNLRQNSPSFVSHSLTNQTRQAQTMTYVNPPHVSVMTRPSDPGIRSISPNRQQIISVTGTQTSPGGQRQTVVLRTTSVLGQASNGNPSRSPTRT